MRGGRNSGTTANVIFFTVIKILGDYIAVAISQLHEHTKSHTMYFEVILTAFEFYPNGKLQN